ncbi:MAG: HEAT repeat domain-containing protein [Planctomycetia bacterium]|nr:HEAT repeat domain-containing protein [Planctomycetia bacterium]
MVHGAKTKIKPQTKMKRRNKTYISLFFTVMMATFIICSPIQLSAADILVLKSGGRVQGQFVTPPTAEDVTYRFRTSDGIVIEIRSEEVAEIEKKGVQSGLEEYEQKKAEMKDTVEGNLEMARWCAENQFLSQRKAHYERVLELDSENLDARRALGYKKMLDGEWRTSDAEMEEQGKVKYKGRWISTQEKELMEKQAEEKNKTKKMAANIKKWVKMLGTAKEESALAELESLRDPLAVPGIQKAYESEKRPAARKVLIKCLGRIGTQMALNSLLQIAVDEKDEELRLTALDNLMPHKGVGVTDYFIMRLSPKKSTNPQINQAAYALGELKDTSAIPALIEALVTTHKFQVVTGNQNGQTTAGAGRSSTGGGGMGFSMGSSVKTVSQSIQNQEVLDALKKITNVNFMYDKTSWIHWYQQSTGGAGATIRHHVE